MSVRGARMGWHRGWTGSAILVLIGLMVVSGCSVSGGGGTGKSSRLFGRIRIPFDMSLGGGGKRLDCDSETERIGRVDGELVCVRVKDGESQTTSRNSKATQD